MKALTIGGFLVSFAKSAILDNIVDWTGDTIKDAEGNEIATLSG